MKNPQAHGHTCPTTPPGLVFGSNGNAAAHSQASAQKVPGVKAEALRLFYLPPGAGYPAD